MRLKTGVDIEFRLPEIRLRTNGDMPSIAGFLNFCRKLSRARGKCLVILQALFGLLLWFRNGDGLARIADFEAHEAAHSDVLAQFADLGCNQLRDADRLVLDEGLLEQADLFIELAHLAFDDLFNDLGRLASGRGLRAIDVLLALEGFRRDVFLADKLWITRRDVHGDVVFQFLEILGTRHKVAFAVHFDEHPDLAASVDVAGNGPFAGHSARLLGSDRYAFLTKKHDRLLEIALGFT